jgi:Complex I intermediate-associated protein 30 (CIA30)
MSRRIVVTEYRDGISHFYALKTELGKWVDVDIPFSAFHTVFRASTVKDGKPVNRSNITAVQIMLSKCVYFAKLALSSPRLSWSH